MNMAHLSLSRAVFDQRERRFNWFKPYCITVFPDQQSDCTSDRQTDKYSTVLRIGLRLLRIPTVATAHSKALHGGSVGGCDARGRGRAGGQPFAAGLRSRSIREGNAHPSGSIASLPIMIRNRQHLLGEYWCVALSFALQLTLVNSRWHNKYRPNNYRPICDPYPGCLAPDVVTDLCPWTFYGELCHVMRIARAAGMPKNALIVEVGSASGYGIWTARHFGHPILGFECRFDEYERLRKQFERDPQVRIVNACVSDERGKTVLHRAIDSSSMLTSSIQANSVEARKAKQDAIMNNVTADRMQEEVTMVTLDDILGVLNVFNDHVVGVIAIDVQGAEPMVLRGAKETIRRHRPLIMYEDTMIAVGERRGVLLKNVLKEISSEIPEKCWANETWHPHEAWHPRISDRSREEHRASLPCYKPCDCERDCVCPPGHYDFNRHALLPYHPR